MLKDSHVHTMTEWNKAYYGQLVGAEIVSLTIGVDEDFGEFWPTFEVVLRDGTKRSIELSKDEEGNGPGFLFGLDAPDYKALEAQTRLEFGDA